MGPWTHCFPYQLVQLQMYESRKLFFMTSLQCHCILGLAEIYSEIKTLHLGAKMHDAQVKLELSENLTIAPLQRFYKYEKGQVLKIFSRKI